MPSIFIPLFIGIVVVIVIVVIIVIIVIILVPVVVLLVLFLLVGLRPAFRLLDTVEIHLVPRFDIDFLDIPIEILDFHELGILVDRQNAELFFFFEVLVPLAGHRLVISAHGNSHPCLHAPPISVGAAVGLGNAA